MATWPPSGGWPPASNPTTAPTARGLEPDAAAAPAPAGAPVLRDQGAASPGQAWQADPSLRPIDPLLPKPDRAGW
jgi:hypothetical protein